jgi:tape measure domain-containing protein
MSTSKVEYILSLKDLFSQQIKNATKDTENLNKAVNNTNSSFSGLATVAAGAFSVYQLTNFARSVMDVGSSFESAEMGLKTFLKTNEAAHSAFLNIQKDAATTPFDFQSLLQANNALISTGMKAESAREDVLALANAVAGSGKGSEELSRMAANLQQIKNLGKANAIDIKQFGIAGINIYGILADAMGKNVEDVKGMEVSYDMLTFALKKAAQQGGLYFNALQNASNTTAGRMSNLKDKFDMFKNTLFLELKPAVSSIISGLSTLMNKIVGGIAFVKEHKAAIMGLSVALGSLYLAYNAQNIISSIAATKTALMTAGTLSYTVATIAAEFATGGFTAGLLALKIALSSNPFGLVVAIVGVVVSAIIWAAVKFDGFRKVLNGTWEVIKGVGMAIFDYLVMPLKMAVDAVKLLWHAMTGQWGEMKKDLKSMGEAIVAPFKDIGQGIANAKAAYNAKDSKKKTTADVAKDKPKLGKQGGAAPVMTPTAGTTKSEASKVSQPQATQIHINIGKLVETQNIKIENATKDFAEKLHNAVAEVLLNVVNDTNRIATQ